MPLTATTAPLAQVLDAMTAEAAEELTDHLENNALEVLRLRSSLHDH